MSEVQQLWAHVKEKKFDAAKDLIIANAKKDNLVNELVNAVNEKGTSLFVSAIFANPQPMPFIKFILGHPKFNPSQHQSGAAFTNIQSIIDLGDTDLLALVIENPKLYVTHDDKLSYELVKSDFDKLNKSYQAKLKKDPRPESHKQIKADVDTYEKMMHMLRDATIVHAVKTDNDELLKRLEKLGVEADVTMLNGKSAAEYLPVRNNTSKVFNLLKVLSSTRMAEHAKQVEKLNGNGFFDAGRAEAARLEAEKQKAQTDKLKADTAVIKKDMEAKGGLLRRLLK